MMMTLRDAWQLLGGAGEPFGDLGTPIRRVHSDTRTLQAGDLFVALRGERFDGNDWLPQARAAGAAAALAERGLAQAGLPGVQVADALAALQQLAAAWRQRMAARLIAVTGSNGKTTVTQMTAAILHEWRGDAALATRGNLNNHIGVPLTLLRLRPRHRVGVLELGTNHPGEIALLAALTRPDVALINNAQREHQEFLAGLDAVARENGSVIAALGEQGTLVLPADDAYTPLWREWAGARTVCRFGLQADAGADADAETGAAAEADVWGRAHWTRDRWTLRIETRHGRIDTTLAIAGRHHVKNALAAAACALAAGAPADAVARGLAAFAPVDGRGRARVVQWRGRPVTLIDDSYNANPDSVLAAIEVLAALRDPPGPRWLLLGDMGEVGAQGPAFHAEVGRHAAARGIERLWTLGRASRLAAEAARAGGVAVRHFDDMDALLAALSDEMPTTAAGGERQSTATAGEASFPVAVLVKGSRSMRMERIVHALRDAREAPDAA